jgi:hypothetical protein
MSAVRIAGIQWAFLISAAWQAVFVAACVATEVVPGKAASPDPAASAAGASFTLPACPWPAEFFPILTWDRLHGWKPPFRNPQHGLKSIAECNFTIGGFATAEDLPECERLGLRVVLPPDESHLGPIKWTSLSAAEIDQRIQKSVTASARNPLVLGYWIADEPNVTAFPALAKVVAAVKKYAPGKLAYINLYPSYATVGAPDRSQLGTSTYTEYLERFAAEVRPQVLSYDNYMVQYSDDLQTEKAALYYADLLEVRRVAAKHGLPFWNVVSGNQIRKFTTIPSPANLAFQAYTTLAAGGRGLSWYKYYQDGYRYAPISNDGQKTETWRYLQMVNHQVRTLGPVMNRLASTGVYFSSPPPAPGLPLLPGRIVREVQSRVSVRNPGAAQPPIMVGEFRDAADVDHVMIVNLSLERSVNIKVDTVRPYAKQEFSSAEDARLTPLDVENGHWLVAGQGVLLRLQGQP